MALSKGLGTYGNGVGTVTPLDHKLANGVKWLRNTSGVVRAGLVFDGLANVVTGRANMAYDVSRFAAVLSRGLTAGAVELVNDGTVTVATAAAPGSNSRIDVIYVWQREFSLDGTDSNPVIGVAQGTAAASPVAPSLAAFPGAVELARAVVPAGITGTTGATITQTAPYAAVAGTAIPARSQAAVDALSGYRVGTLAEDVSSGVVYRFDGASWKNAKSGLIASGTISGLSTIDIDGLTGGDDYEITLILPSASTGNDISVQLRAAGVVNSSANYDKQTDYAVDTTSAGTSALGATSWASVLGAGRTDKTFRFRTVGLNKAERTVVFFDATAFNASADPYTQRGSLRHRSASAFDGVRFNASSGTVTGRYEVRAV